MPFCRHSQSVHLKAGSSSDDQADPALVSIAKHSVRSVSARMFRSSVALASQYWQKLKQLYFSPVAGLMFAASVASAWTLSSISSWVRPFAEFKQLLLRACRLHCALSEFHALYRSWMLQCPTLATQKFSATVDAAAINSTIIVRWMCLGLPVQLIGDSRRCAPVPACRLALRSLASSSAKPATLFLVR